MVFIIYKRDALKASQRYTNFVSDSALQPGSIFFPWAALGKLDSQLWTSVASEGGFQFHTGFGYLFG